MRTCLKIDRVRTYVVYLTLMVAGCADLDAISSLICESPCYTGPAETQGVGVCIPGKPLCDQTGEFRECVGEVTPSDEICDGEDNDCDGVVDEIPDRTNETCGPSFAAGDCRAGHPGCRAGHPVCVGAVYPTEEICDGRDNDCDGVTDEYIVTGPCYEGEPSELLSPMCRAGVEICVSGEMRCMGQTRGSAERCDGLDNDCNGLVDDTIGGPEAIRMLDVVLHVDNSNSMINRLPHLREIFGTLGEHFANDSRFLFAVIAVPGEQDKKPQMLLDLNPGNSVTAGVRHLQGLNGGYEPTHDSPYLATMGSLSISWRPGARRIHVLVTDEQGQSYLSPILHEEDVAETLAGRGDVFFYLNAARPDEIDFSADYDDIVTRTGGRMLTTWGLAETLMLELENLLTPCIRSE